MTFEVKVKENGVKVIKCAAVHDSLSLGDAPFSRGEHKVVSHLRKVTAALKSVVDAQEDNKFDVEPETWVGLGKAAHELRASLQVVLKRMGVNPEEIDKAIEFAAFKRKADKAAQSLQSQDDTARMPSQGIQAGKNVGKQASITEWTSGSARKQTMDEWMGKTRAMSQDEWMGKAHGVALDAWLGDAVCGIHGVVGIRADSQKDDGAAAEASPVDASIERPDQQQCEQLIDLFKKIKAVVDHIALSADYQATDEAAVFSRLYRFLGELIEQHHIHHYNNH
ncbi:hypothetical protein [Burkholderia gladioli]|uniref:hypothetical protein n=1 Tax=Burkholderia gladioli TaxID=28095 RepID=UPI0016404E4D|nr:hypothetical protein [Burkholderia gladioli]